MQEETLKDAKIITTIFNVFKHDSAIIAGGCVRDFILSRQPKDIDVMVEYEDSRDYNEVRILADRLGYTVFDHGENYGYGSDNIHDHCRRVLTLTKPDRLPIDVIFLNCPVRDRVPNFPCTMSQAWLDNTGLHQTDANIEAIKTRTLTFGKGASTEYIERMRTYFPDYKVELDAYERRD